MNPQNEHQKLLAEMSRLGITGKDKKETWRIMSKDGYEAATAFLLFLEQEKPPPIKLLNEDRYVPTWGKRHIDPAAIAQMKLAMRLPIMKFGAQMPDSHVGYFLPIGAVGGVDNAVIPYGIGVDIGCQVNIAIFDIEWSDELVPMLVEILKANTRFGAGCNWIDRLPDHHIMADKRWEGTKLLKSLKANAHNQLGTSGGGNHFVEFGYVLNHLQETPVKYLALVSHSGSRGLGARLADHYTKLASKLCPTLPKELEQGGWLSMDREEGQEYWEAMHLAGDYAEACHDVIHQRISDALKVERPKMLGSRHNFAWRERHMGSDLIVHRKGATPAAFNQDGYIPGTMTDRGYIVKGKGSSLSMSSASHGAGRAMSRRKAVESLSKDSWQKHLQRYGVTLIGGSLDESPEAYKKIWRVMEDQFDLVEAVQEFVPKVVHMAADGFAED